MSAGREHRRRYELRLAHMREFEWWLMNEPPMILFWRWRAWKRQRPEWSKKTWAGKRKEVLGAR